MDGSGQSAPGGAEAVEIRGLFLHYSLIYPNATDVAIQYHYAFVASPNGESTGGAFVTGV